MFGRIFFLILGFILGLLLGSQILQRFIELLWGLI